MIAADVSGTRHISCAALVAFPRGAVDGGVALAGRLILGGAGGQLIAGAQTALGWNDASPHP